MALLAPNDVPGDEYWDDVFSLEGVSGPVYAVAAYGGYICIGGDFTQVGSLAAQNIACWNNSTGWLTSARGVSGPVYALASPGASGLYVGGQFGQAGDISAQNIAFWKPLSDQWEAVGAGLSGPVYVLAVRARDRSLYAGGQFSQAGAVAANNVARWDTEAKTWSALAQGWSNGVSGPVHALAAPRDSYDVFVGGDFAGIGGVSPVNAHNIARWNSDSRTWAEVDGSVSGPVYALTFCGELLYVGGRFSQAGTLAASNIAAWDGVTATWSTLGTGTSNTVEAVACVGNRVYAGGRFNQAGRVAANHVARWNTTSQSWAALGRGTSGVVYGIVITALRDVYVGGAFAGAGATGSRNFARFIGDYDQSNPEDVHWVREFCMAGPNDQVSAIAASGDSLYYGGHFTETVGLAANGIALYDTNSKSWSAIGTGVNGDVEAINVSGSDVYVGGDFTQAGGIAAANIARWNSATGEWSALGSGTDGPVHAIAISGDIVYVGGNFATAGGVTVNHIARWDNSGQSWSALGGGASIGTNGRVNALDISGSDLYAGGEFTLAQDVAASNVARWDGSAWHALGDGVLGVGVLALFVQGDDLYVGGSFSKAGGRPAAAIARWDGTSWHAMPGLMGNVWTIAFNLGEIYVGGSFYVLGRSDSRGVARWDGAQWQPLGSGVRNSFALAVGTNGLYLGGGFWDLWNGHLCNRTALWKTRTTPPGTGSISGRVRGQAGAAVSGASVQVCDRSEIECTWLGTTDANGDYQVASLSDGEYLVRAYPPQGLAGLPAAPDPVVISGGGSLKKDMDLPGISPLPSGKALSPSRQTSSGVPLVNWRQDTQLIAQGCTGGSATYQLLQGGTAVTGGALAEGPAGQYSATLASLHPISGYIQLIVSITCPNLTISQSDAFDVYVDPSGTVKDGFGQPVEGAQMTLYAFDPVTLSLIQVSEGDSRLSPANQDNPDLTDSAGHFGWDASAGAYVIRAEKEGCVSPSNSALAFVQTGVIRTPLEMVDLELRLECATDAVFIPLVIR